ncbi:hypothetical protein ACN47A_24550 [Myxococcus fulvus]|uniref:hypothetical protein n=1 Tax=Myxococcus fulvus TaxID=33 RepID=UPI003B993317
MRARRETCREWTAVTVAVGLSLGCASTERVRSGTSGAYAQATCTDTVTCCLQRNVGNPEACGLTAAEAGKHISAAMALDAAGEKSEEKDDPDEGWKQQCMDLYVLCKDQKKPRWTGDCYACFRNCEGQRQWPFSLCRQGR